MFYLYAIEMTKIFRLILASGSPRRKELLGQLNMVPDKIISPNIDETPQKQETPKQLSMRLSQEKAHAVHQENSSCYVLAADTVVACGRQILDKAETSQSAEMYLLKLSGRRHQVHGGITLITPEGKTITRHCLTRVQFKPLAEQEISAYIQSKEWEGKAGGYAIQGFAGSFVKYISGSYSNVVGLSLYDTMSIFKSAGAPLE